MPKKLINDYIFYKIVCLDNSCDLFYIGSTANWKERQRNHKSSCNNENSKEYNTKKYQTIRANGGWCNFKMIEIGTAEQLTVRQAEKIEEYYREELKASLNGKRCYLSKEQKQEQRRKFREANNDKIKKYREANKDKMKEYYINNEDKIKANASEKITCECGCEIRRDDIARHKKSQKHLNLISIEDISVVTTTT